MPNGQGPAPVPQQAAPMVPPADPNQNQGFNMDMQVSVLLGWFARSYCTCTSANLGRALGVWP